MTARIEKSSVRKIVRSFADERQYRTAEEHDSGIDMHFQLMDEFADERQYRTAEEHDSGIDMHFQPMDEEAPFLDALPNAGAQHLQEFQDGDDGSLARSRLMPASIPPAFQGELLLAFASIAFVLIFW